MLLVDTGYIKDLISQQMKNMKRETARLMQLRRKLNAAETADLRLNSSLNC